MRRSGLDDSAATVPSEDASATDASSLAKSEAGATAACEAASDGWDFVARLDTSNCTSRAPAACLPAVATTEQIVEALIQIAHDSGCVLPPEVDARVEFVGGCATLFQSSEPPRDDPFPRCFATALSVARVGCADQLSCVLVQLAGLPP
ncbi:MAG TPA: hypothetical protein VH560_00900 [Polyangia bacterium]|nr:hypothetical protein [Polyangia bacterium]